ncbi:RadC family protein [Photobacterium indicum]|uniref:RadC family protein n=1 Tax=Photobacterium indicum TaxID=81447 RepID=UPI003D0AF07E
MLYTAQEKDVLSHAAEIIESKLKVRDVFRSPDMARTFCVNRLAHKEYEVLGVLFLDDKNQLLAFVEMFRGTINMSAVYPREIVREALKHNASNIILTHNHPSNDTEASQSDRNITRRIADALALIDIKVLDHFIVGGKEALSFAENGWL